MAAIETFEGDRRGKLTLHRHITISGATPETLDLDAAVLYLPSGQVDRPFDPRGAKNVEARLYFGALIGQAINNKTCTVVFVGVPPFSGDETPRARVLLSVIATAESGHTHKDPQTHLVSATREWHEPDTFGTLKPFTGYDVLDGTTSGAGAQDIGSVIRFDPCGMRVYAFCTAADFSAIDTPTLDVCLLDY